GFKILDELQVPERVEYIAVSEVEQALDAVRSMKTRAFGQVLVFLYAGAILAERYAREDGAALRARIAALTEQFCAARPTFDFRGLEAFFDDWLRGLPDGAPAGAPIAEQARQFGRQIIGARLARARRAAESRARADPLQRERRAGRGRAVVPRAGQRVLGHRHRDAALSSGRASHRLGARRSRRGGDADSRWRRGASAGARRSERGDRRRRSCRAKRRRGQ